MKRSRMQWILSILLAVITTAMAVAGTVGYVMRSSSYVSEKLMDMRTYAVIHSAATGIIDDIALKAKNDAKAWATTKNETTGEPNVKGRDNQRDYYNAASEKARADAEAMYAKFGGMDITALDQAIVHMEASEKAYYDAEAQEKQIYSDVFRKSQSLATEQIAIWMTDLEGRAISTAQLTEERLTSIKPAYDDLSAEEKASQSKLFAQAASALAVAFGLPAVPDGQDGFESLTNVASAALPLYTALSTAAKSEVDQTLVETYSALTRLMAGLNGSRWASAKEEADHLASFTADATAIASEAYTSQYGILNEDAKNGFIKAFQKIFTNSLEDARALDVASQSGEEAAVSEDTIDSSLLVKIDYIGFTGSDALTALQQTIDAEYDNLWATITTLLPNLADDMKKDQKAGVENVIYSGDASFEGAFARYSGAGTAAVLAPADAFWINIASNAYNLILGAFAMLAITLVAFYYQPLVKKLGVPRLIIGVFFILLLILSGLYGLSMSSMMSNVLKRTGQYGILVLAMLPGIQSGISLNMGMTVGIVAGLLSTLIALEIRLTGWAAFCFAIVVGCLIAAPIGWAYSKLLNRLKGNEMTVSTYVGFSFVSLMSIFWMILPFHNPKLTWALGSGLRVMHSMAGNIGGLLNNFLSFQILGVTVPTGLLFFLMLCCGALWLFSRSRTGTAMIAAGSNPRFAEAAGIQVDRMRTIGTTISTMIAAIGIIVYSQSFGFMQLYSGPRQMGFTAASAILIGGASTSRAKVSHVIIGTFLFQGVLSMGILVANEAISASGLSEVMRILISNGIILYALTQSGGEN